MSTEDAASLVFKFDTTSAPAAVSDMDKVAKAAQDAEKQADSMIKSWERQNATMGKSRAQVMAYDADQMKMTATQREAAIAAIRAADAYDKQQLALGKSADLMRGFIGYAKNAAMAFVAAAAAIYGFSVKAAQEAEQASLKVDAALKATGEQAGVTKAMIDGYADSLAATTKFDDESIRNASAALLTFQNVGKDTFERTLKVATDLGTFMGTDLESAVRTVGRALEDPERGMSTLRRAGILLSQSQAELIKQFQESGDTIGAQNILLEALEQRVGGAAETMNTGLSKATNDLSKATGELFEAIGKTDIVSKSYVGTLGLMTGAMGRWQAVVEMNQETMLRYWSSFVWGGKAALEQIDKMKAWGTEDGNDRRAKAAADASREAQKELEKEALRVNEAQKAWGKYNDQFADKGAKRAAMHAEIERTGKLLGLASSEIDRMQRAYDKANPSVQRAAKEQKEVNKEYAKVIELLEEVSEHGKEYDKMVEALNNQYAAGTIGLVQWIDGHNKAYATLSNVKRAIDDLAEKSMKTYNDALAKQAETLADGVTKLEEQAAAEELRAQTFGMSEAAITDMTIAQEKSNLAVLQATDANYIYIKAAELRIAALERLRNAQQSVEGKEANKRYIEEQKTAYKDLVSYLEDITKQLWGAVVQKGGNAFEKITEIAKNTLYAFLYKMTLQPFIINVATSLSGVAGGALGGGGGVGGTLIDGITSIFGGNGPLGSLMSGVTSAFSSFATSAIGTALGLSAEVSAIAGGLSLGVEAAGAVGTSLTAMGASLAAAVPVVGAIALGAYALWEAFGNKGGGPKGGGFASMGDVSGISGTDSTGRWFTPSSADADLTKVVAEMGKGFADIAKALGLKTGTVGFALGYDTDPQGTADNRAHSGAFMNGQQIYNYASGDKELGRDDKTLQARLELESKRAVLAAIMASEMPEYLSRLFDGIEASTATADQIDAVLEMAQTLKTAVDIVSQLGPQFEGLDAEAMLDFVESMGGLDGLAQSFQFIGENFTTNADKVKVATEMLDAGFAEMGEKVPESHEAFMNMLKGIDVTTEAGRQQYATMMRLGQAYVYVNGTAEAAAEGERQLADERKRAAQAAQELFEAEFYTEGEQKARDVANAWTEVHKAWAANAIQLHAMGYDHIPTTTAAFRALIESIDRTTPAGEQLYQSMILLTPAMIDLGAGIQDVVEKVEQAVVDLFAIATDEFSSIMSGVTGLAGMSDGDMGDKLGLTSTALQGAIKKLQAEMAALDTTTQAGMLRYKAIQGILNMLNAELGKTAAQLARFTILEAQYGAEKAEQLFQLEEQYKAQQALLAGNVEALAALAQIFDAKWKAILDGTAGVGTELGRLQQNIRDFLKSLMQSELSPLSPQAKFAEAQKEYLDLLAKAQAGDTEALAKLPAAAEAYLKIAQEMYGSSMQYNQIFQSIVDALTLLAPEPPATGGPDPLLTVASAMPSGSPITSKADVMELKAEVSSLKAQISALTEVIAQGNASVAAAVMASGAAVQREVATAGENRR